MPHPSTLVLCALLVKNTLGFAFVGVAPSLCSGGRRWTLPRSTASTAAVSQTVRRVRRGTYDEPKHQQDHQHQGSGGRQGFRGGTRRARRISATAHDDEDDAEVASARCGKITEFVRVRDRQLFSVFVFVRCCCTKYQVLHTLCTSFRALLYLALGIGNISQYPLDLWLLERNTENSVFCSLGRILPVSGSPQLLLQERAHAAHAADLQQHCLLCVLFSSTLL